VTSWLRARNSKSAVEVEIEATVMDIAAGAVAGRDDDKNEEVSSGAVATCVASACSRARTKSMELKETQTYSVKLGHITSTFNAWGAF
jgi:hypothetical protein